MPKEKWLTKAQAIELLRKGEHYASFEGPEKYEVLGHVAKSCNITHCLEEGTLAELIAEKVVLPTPIYLNGYECKPEDGWMADTPGRDAHLAKATQPSDYYDRLTRMYQKRQK